MKDRFIQLLLRFDIPRVIAEDVWHDLSGCYREPHRYYHTLAYIEQGLIEFDNLKKIVPALNSQGTSDDFELAWWFHNAVYSLECDTNSIESVKFLNDQIGSNLSMITRSQVAILILMTGDVFQEGTFYDLMRDISYAVLGKSPNVFTAYCSEVEQEALTIMNEQEFIDQRIYWVEKILSGKNIYWTKEFQEQYEWMAKSNLERLIKQLKKRRPWYQRVGDAIKSFKIFKE